MRVVCPIRSGHTMPFFRYDQQTLKSPRDPHRLYLKGRIVAMSSLSWECHNWLLTWRVGETQ